MAELYYGVPDQLPDYQSQIDSGLSQSKEALDAARQVVINRRNADTKFRTDLYQNDLGQMYDGDREAAEKMRQYIEFQYQEGLYNDDPSKFARIVANYNAQVDMFTNHYKTTHGTSDTADSKIAQKSFGEILEIQLLAMNLIRLNRHTTSLMLDCRV